MNYQFSNEDLIKILNFDWMYYNNYYNIKSNCKIKTFLHYKKNKNLYFENNWNLIYKRNLELFYKYEMKHELPYKLIEYSTKNIDFIKKNNYAVHIHCFNLNLFRKKFYYSVDKLMKYLDIFVTYTNLDEEIIKEYDFINFIKIPNKGLDIGAKMVFTQYLKDYNLNYEYVLFIHSKSRINKKSIFEESLVNNIEILIQMLSKNNKIGGIFPPIIHFGNKSIYENNKLKLVKQETWGNNKYYIDLLKKYFNINESCFFFPAGNFYILKDVVYTHIFGDSLIYNILNEQSSYDYNWCRTQYNLFNQSQKSLYCFCKKQNLDLNYYQNYKGNRDYMIEHSFERLIFLFLNKYNLKIQIVNNNFDNLEEINRILNNLD